MTCIAALAMGGDVWMAADSGSSNGEHRHVIAEPKIVRHYTNMGSLLIGYTTSFRWGQILKHHVQPPEDTRAHGADYLVQDLIPVIRAAMSEHGWMKKFDERERIGNALVGYRDDVFEIQVDGSVIQDASGFLAVGSGYQFALGAWQAILQLPSYLSSPYLSKPQDVMRLVIGAAERCDPHVMGPISIENLSGESQ